MAAKKPAPAQKAVAKPVEKFVSNPVSSPSSSAVSSPVRNTPIPKPATAVAPAPKVITQEQIAKRAFEIHMGGTGGSEADNWFRAERELRGK